MCVRDTWRENALCVVGTNNEEKEREIQRGGRVLFFVRLLSLFFLEIKTHPLADHRPAEDERHVDRVSSHQELCVE